jgi:hypothetical protein
MGKGFGFLFEMGCGKTLTAIAVTGAGYKLGKIKRVLIVAPTSVCAVWPKEFADYADFRYTVKTLLGTKPQRLKALADLEAFPFQSLKVAVINYESTWRDGIFEKLMEYDADLIIADESQRIKTHDAAQSKSMHQLGDKARYKLILSGTPVQNEAVDIFSQYRFLDPTIFGTNFYAFRNRYAVMGGFNRKQIVQYKDLDELIRKEHSIAYRVTKEEALDLPEQTFQTRSIILSAKERAIYDRLRRDSFTELDNGGKITATTVLTKLLRLQQFTGGFSQAGAGQHREARCPLGHYPRLRSGGQKEIGDLRPVHPGGLGDHQKVGEHHRKERHENGGHLRSHPERAAGRHRPAVPERPLHDGSRRSDRHGGHRHHPDRSRHLRLLQRHIQLRHLLAEPRPHPPYRPAQHLHIHPPRSREHRGQHHPQVPEQKRGSRQNGGR